MTWKRHRFKGTILLLGFLQVFNYRYGTFRFHFIAIENALNYHLGAPFCSFIFAAIHITSHKPLLTDIKPTCEFHSVQRTCFLRSFCVSIFAISLCWQHRVRQMVGRCIRWRLTDDKFHSASHPDITAQMMWKKGITCSDFMINISGLGLGQSWFHSVLERRPATACVIAATVFCCRVFICRGHQPWLLCWSAFCVILLIHCLQFEQMSNSRVQTMTTWAERQIWLWVMGLQDRLLWLHSERKHMVQFIIYIQGHTSS